MNSNNSVTDEEISSLTQLTYLTLDENELVTNKILNLYFTLIKIQIYPIVDINDIDFMIKMDNWYRSTNYCKEWDRPISTYLSYFLRW